MPEVYELDVKVSQLVWNLPRSLAALHFQPSMSITFVSYHHSQYSCKDAIYMQLYI